MFHSVQRPGLRGISASAERLRGLARPVGLFAVAVVLGRARLMLSLSPFAAALLAAGLFSGENPAALLLGCLIGAGLGGWVDGRTLLLAPAGSAIIWGGWLALSGRGRPKRRAGSAAPALLAGVGVLLPGLALQARGLEPLEVALCLAAALLAGLSEPAFASALNVRPGRTRLMADELAGLAGIAGALLLGLTRFGLPPLRWLAQALAALGVLLAAGVGPGEGAAAGLLAGGCLALGGFPFSGAACWGLAGAAAGLGARVGRWTSACLLPAALGIGLLYAPGSHDLYPALAALALPLVPEAGWNRLLGALDARRRGACDPDLLAARLRAESEARLRALSAAFGELADGYRTPVDVPDEQTLLTDMRAALCEGCARYAACWTGEDNRAVRLLCQLISQAIERGCGPDPDEAPPPDVMRVCARGRSIARRLGGILGDFAVRRQSELKRGAANQLLSAQFAQAQLVLRGLADRQARPLQVRSRQAGRALAALDRIGLPAADVLVFRGERVEVVVTLARGQWTPEWIRRAADCVSAELGRRFAAGPRRGQNEKELRLVQQPKLRARAGVSCLSAEAGVPSGDSHLIRMLHGDRLLVALSDGMGSGEAAARESAQTLRLLWRFLSADVGRALALETVNGLMLAGSGEDIFATVDLCLLDLTTGRAEFSKLAACRSLIVRNGELLRVEGGRLPLGILEKVQPSVTAVQLRPGDVLLLGTDGVMDAPRDAALVETALRRHASLPPTELAGAVLHAVQTSEGLRFRDDMTAVCVRLSRRREKL